MQAEWLRVLVAAMTALAILGCVSRAPAPVDDRSAPRAAAKPAAPPAPTPDTYVVKRGDTLYSIALDQGVDWRELAAWNQLGDAAKLQVGQVLRVRPPQAPAAAEGVVVSPIDAGQPIVTRPLGAETPPGGAAVPAPPAPVAVVPPVTPGTSALKTEPKGVRLPYSDENLAALERAETARAAAKPDAPAAAAAKPEPSAAAKPEPPAAAKPEPAVPKAEPDAAGERVDWMWPATGKVVATFNGTASKGVDIAGRVGDPVFASAAGKVVYSGEGIPAYGKLVIIRHNNTYLSAYAHNSQILVKEGQNVARGQKIAEVGRSGAREAKLHFEIRRLGKPVDPLAYLPTRPN
jgi:lipoprotein NlpD